jgi:hypothetical protein
MMKTRYIALLIVVVAFCVGSVEAKGGCGGKSGEADKKQNQAQQQNQKKTGECSGECTK